MAPLGRETNEKCLLQNQYKAKTQKIENNHLKKYLEVIMIPENQMLSVKDWVNKAQS